MTWRGQYFLWGLLLTLASFLFATDAMAQANLQDPSGSFTGLLDLVKQSASQWDGRLRGYATTLFWLLASIQFVWTFFPLVFRQSDLGEIVGELIRFVLVIGFWYALLLFSKDWGEAVVNSFRQAGSSAAGLGDTSIKPGDIFDVAVQLANTIGDVETWNPLTAFMVALAGVLVLLCFAFIAAFMGLTIIESYIVINAAVLFTGFGGSQWTREYAMAIVRYAVSVGAKLFVLTLLVGLIITSAKQWQAAYNHDDASMWTMIGLALACAYFCKTLPELVAGIISGASMSGGGAVGGIAAAGAAGAAAAVATIATAGAAAPAAGALGVGGAGGGAGGGLAGMLNQSLMGGAAGAGAGAGGATGAGTASGVGQAGGTAGKAAAPRIGGGAEAGPSAPAPKPPGGATGGGGQQGTNGATQAAQQAGKAAQAGGEEDGQEQQQPSAAGAEPAEATAAPSESSAPPAEGSPASSEAGSGSSDGGGSNTGHRIASGVLRTAGVLSAISVPGMEGAAGLSLGAPQPVPGDGGRSAGQQSDLAPEGADNIIRPTEVSATPAQTPSAPSEAPAAPGGDVPADDKGGTP